jgi:hypothetical protein
MIIIVIIMKYSLFHGASHRYDRHGCLDENGRDGLLIKNVIVLMGVGSQDDVSGGGNGHGAKELHFFGDSKDT